MLPLMVMQYAKRPIYKDLDKIPSAWMANAVAAPTRSVRLALLALAWRGDD